MFLLFRLLISRFMKRLFAFCFFLGLFVGLSAQEPLIRKDSYGYRRDALTRMPADTAFLRAIREAKKLGIPDRRLYPDGRVVAIRRISPTGMPQYLSTSNLDAARTVSSDRVWKDGGLGLDLSGKNLVVGVWDAGVLRVTHKEFEDRARIMNPDADVVGHATHVSGTIGAGGLEMDARGMASEVILESYDWDNDFAEMDAAAADGLLISNHSYGFIVGWDYNSEERRWQWWGDTEISQEEDYLFGYYHSEARDFDRIAYDHPSYLIVKSAGNDRGEGLPPGSEHHVWDNGEWVSSMAFRQIDGGEEGFGSIGPLSTSKNILVVGASGDLPGGVEEGDSVEITDYSVFGPTDDGRIKPDILSSGESLYSSYTGSDSAYRRLSGTSMSAPGASGSLALLQEHHQRTYGTFLNAAALKALVLHTADDAGNPGPDYRHGWGLLNTAEAAKIIGDTLEERIFNHLLQDGEELRFSFYSDGSQPVKLTLCWTDPAGDVPAPSLNPIKRILVNDLDMKIIRTVDGKEYKAFVLDPVNPAANATTGDNVLDNVEQVLISASTRGYYDIVISHKEKLKNGNQAFSFVISGLVDEYYASGFNQLKDNNGAFMLTSAAEYLPETEVGWLITPENNMPISLSFTRFETEADHDFVRIYDGGSPDSPLLAEFSGTLLNPDTLISASGDSIWVSFSSDEQNQAGGFEATYCTTAPEGLFSLEGSSYPCAASEESYFVHGQAGSLYHWIKPENWELLESGNSIARFLTAPGDALLEIRPYNSCGEGKPDSLMIYTLDSTPVLERIKGDSLLCSGAASVLEVDSLPGSTYRWILPGDWLGSSETYRINFIPSSNQGEIKVSAGNACGPGDTLYIPGLVKSAPGDVSIETLTDPLCQNDTGFFYINPEEGVEYQWSVGESWEISGASDRDSVLVLLGENGNSMFLEARNECGNLNLDKFFSLTDKPEYPLLMATPSVYENIPELRVQNATDFTLIQWYLNGVVIDSPLATGPKYVAYVPGIYSVGVRSREACSLLQDADQGINISNPDNLFSVNAGADGDLIIHNTSNNSASLYVYDLAGKIQIIREVPPGQSVIKTSLSGVQLASVSGSGKVQVFRLFIR